jgi:hypothetical protein
MAGCVMPNSRATAGMLRFSTRLAITASRRPLRIEANSDGTSAVAPMPPRATSCARASSNSRSMRRARTSTSSP